MEINLTICLSYIFNRTLKIITKPKVKQSLWIFMQSDRLNFKPRQISEQYSKEFDQIKKTQQ